jgi:hypothetical protein
MAARLKDHVPSILEVLAKSALIHHLPEIAVDVDRIRTTQSRKLAFRQNTQELGLEIERQVANLVQKERPAVGLLETAYLRLHRKRSTQIAEHFAFRQNNTS